MPPKIAILIPYFGKWPEWINFFVESCRSNSDVDWFLIGNSDPPENRCTNVHHLPTAFEAYREFLSQRLETRIAAETPYKLCDIRPALPFAHADLLSSYEFAGFGDLDVIYGSIRSFYDSDLLANHDILSTHPDRISGHLCLMRNVPEIVTAFRHAPGWGRAARQPQHVGFDERGFFDYFRGTGRRLFRRKPPGHRCYFHEAYSTPAPAQAMRWHWKDGVLTNQFYPHHPFLYLHFMNWHSNRWYAGKPGVEADTPAPWSLLHPVVRMDWRDARTRGFTISPGGIEPLDRAG